MSQLSDTQERPEFMVQLGLAPPYSAQDVKEAYFEHAKRMHPDKGGTPEAFRQLQEAFEQAQKYVEFRANRMQWLGLQIERYVAQRELADGLERWGGVAEFKSIEWMKRSYGDDFAQVVDMLVNIHLVGPNVDNEAVEFLVQHHAQLPELISLDLSNSRVDDRGVIHLYLLSNLQKLDLSGTAISSAGLTRLVQHLPTLSEIRLKRSRVSWLTRWKLRRKYRQLRLV